MESPSDLGIGRAFYSGIVGASILSLPAILTKSASELAFIFDMTFPRCALTVISLMLNSPPTCLFKSPATTSCMTRRSRCVRDA